MAGVEGGGHPRPVPPTDAPPSPARGRSPNVYPPKKKFSPSKPFAPSLKNPLSAVIVRLKKSNFMTPRAEALANELILETLVLLREDDYAGVFNDNYFSSEFLAKCQASPRIHFLACGIYIFWLQLRQSMTTAALYIPLSNLLVAFASFYKWQNGDTEREIIPMDGFVVHHDLFGIPVWNLFLAFWCPHGGIVGDGRYCAAEMSTEELRATCEVAAIYNFFPS